MGIDFDGWAGRTYQTAPHWSYMGFHRFRERLAMAIGIDLNQMDGFNGKRRWDNVLDPIAPLLNHSDCDGELAPNVCATVAPRLRALVAAWPDDDYDKVNALLLAAGMDACAHENAPLEFC